MLQLDRQTISVAIRFLKAKTPEQRAAVDLDTHYTKVNNQVQTRNLVALENLYIGRYCYIKKIKRAISSFKSGVPLERSNGMYEDNLEIDSVLFTLIISEVSFVTARTHMMFILMCRNILMSMLGLAQEEQSCIK